MKKLIVAIMLTFPIMAFAGNVTTETGNMRANPKSDDAVSIRLSVAKNEYATTIFMFVSDKYAIRTVLFRLSVEELAQLKKILNDTSIEYQLQSEPKK